METRRKQIKIIHRLLIEMRIYIFEGKTHKELFRFIDTIEILPAMLLEPNFKIEEFDKLLKLICEEFNLDGVWTQYQNLKD